MLFSEIVVETSQISFSVLMLALYVVTIAAVILDNQKISSSTLAWILVVVFVPYVGIVFYLLFGRNWRRKNKRELEREKKFHTRLHKFLADQKNFPEQKLAADFLDFPIAPLTKFLATTSAMPLTATNSVEIFHAGKDKFTRLIADLKTAQRFIDMQYFIWGDDEWTHAIHEILIAKARAGVEVRVSFDFVGCLTRFSNSEKRRLRKAGVQLATDSRALGRLNYRNHRKIVVIDGEIGYTGGMNLAREYVDGGDEFPVWRDTHLRLTGLIVEQLHVLFAQRWLHATHENLLTPKFQPTKKASGSIPLFLLASGPESERMFIRESFLTLINLAQKSVRIETPYFVLDPTIEEAIKNAALRGVTVEIAVGLNDKKIGEYAATTYFEDVLAAGARIFHFGPGFLHAKVLVVDSALAVVGTANFDIRSFALNYEDSVLIFNHAKAGELEKQFRKDLKSCHEITLAEVRKIGVLKKTRNSIARLASNLL